MDLQKAIAADPTHVAIYHKGSRRIVASAYNYSEDQVPVRTEVVEDGDFFDLDHMMRSDIGKADHWRPLKDVINHRSL